MRHLLFIFICMLSVNIFAEELALQNIRIWAAPYSTRVVFDLDGAIKHDLLRLSNPERLAIDLQNIRLSPAAKEVLNKSMQPGKYLKNIRSAKRNQSDLRIVFDLQNVLTIKSFLLPPNRQYGHRLVIDFFSAQEQQQQPSVLSVPDEGYKRSENIIIAIDAGHGGEDPGAMGPSGLHEKTVTLKIAKKLANLINQIPSMQAVLIREGDYFISLSGRIKKAREHRADMFISIHADAFKDAKVRGSSVYILSNKGASSEAAKWLAERENASDLIGGVSLDDKDDVVASVILDFSLTGILEASMDVAGRVLSSLNQLGKTHKKDVQAASFVVLKSPDIPSILIEVAYISNPTEEKKLKNSQYQTRIAKTVLSGITSYFTDYPPEGVSFVRLQVREHRIKRGDTLSEIAQQYNVSTQTLRTFNKLKSDKIHIGQIIKIPAT